MPRRKSSAAKRRRRVSGATSVRVTGVVAQGSAIEASEETVTIPADRIETGEVVYRVAGDFLGLADRDLLIVEPRPAGNAATGEFVIATVHERAFLGRWWAKHGDRMILDNDFHSVAQAPELQVLGAVTLIVRESL